MADKLNPVHDLLKGDMVTVGIAHGALSRLWRIILYRLKIQPMRWDTLLSNYRYRAESILPASKTVNLKGNMGKTLVKTDMSWELFHKGISILGLAKPILVVTIQHDGLHFEHSIPIEFTIDEDRNHLLAILWNEIIRVFKARHDDWPRLMTDYSNECKSIGTDMKSSLRTNLTGALKEDRLMWGSLYKAIQVMRFDHAELVLEYGSKGRFFRLEI